MVSEETQGATSSVQQRSLLKRLMPLGRILIAPIVLGVTALIWFYPFRLGAIAFDDIGNTLGFLNPHLTVVYRTLVSNSTNRWRPVYTTLGFIEANIFRTHYEYYFWFNVMFLAFISFLLYRIVLRITSSALLGLAIGIVFLTSRDTYYLVTQTLGLLELLGLMFVVLIVGVLIRFEQTGQIKYLGWATLYYALDGLTHERYLTLVLFLIVLVITSRHLQLKDKLLWSGVFCLPFLFNVGMKHFFFHMPLLVGTGSATSLGFTWKTAVQFFNQGMLNVFGINNGPTYLDGIVFQALPTTYRVFSVVLVALAALVPIAAFIFGSGARKKGVIESGPRRSILLGIILILLLTLSVSVTIRVEPRFIYAPTTVLLVVFAYGLSLLVSKKYLRLPVIVVLIIFVAMSVASNKVYSDNESGVYFMSARAQALPVVQMTVTRFGDGLATRPVYVIDPTTSDNWTAALDPIIMANSSLGPVNLTTVANVMDIPIGHNPIIYDVTGGLHIYKAPVNRNTTNGIYRNGWAGHIFMVTGICQSLVLTIRPYRPGPRFHVMIHSRGQALRRYPLHSAQSVITLSGKQFGGALDATFNRIYSSTGLGVDPALRNIAAQVDVKCITSRS